MLGEDVELLLPFAESLSVTRTGTERYAIGGSFDDEYLLPVARALLRAEAAMLTESSAQTVARKVSPQALTHLVLEILSAPVGPALRQRQVAAMWRHQADLQRHFPIPRRSDTIGIRSDTMSP